MYGDCRETATRDGVEGRKPTSNGAENGTNGTDTIRRRNQVGKRYTMNSGSVSDEVISYSTVVTSRSLNAQVYTRTSGEGKHE